MNNAFDEVDAWLDNFLKNYNAQYEQLKAVEMVLCPPAFLLDYLDSELMEDGIQFFDSFAKKNGRQIESFSAEEVNEIVIGNRPFRLGAQDCHHEESGSFTGDISAKMLKQVGCEYVILGHSERRENHFETNEIISKKVKAALKQNIVPIICVGESKETRDAKKHLEFVYKQVMQSVPQDVKFKKLVIAYEPIWSIGTGVTPTTEQITEMAKLMKKIFVEKFPALSEEFFMLYGGSVTSQNSKEILAILGVDGLLIGKASLDAEEFIKISIS